MTRNSHEVSPRSFASIIKPNTKKAPNASSTTSGQPFTPTATTAALRAAPFTKAHFNKDCDEVRVEITAPFPSPIPQSGELIPGRLQMQTALQTLRIGLHGWIASQNYRQQPERRKYHSQRQLSSETGISQIFPLVRAEHSLIGAQVQPHIRLRLQAWT